MTKKLILIITLLISINIALANENQTNQTETNSTIENNNCNIELFLDTEKSIYNNQETIKFTNHLNNEDHDFTIQYHIEDLYGNIIKKHVNTSNTNQKQFTPDIKTTIKTLIIKNKLTYIDCNNTNTHTENEKIIIVKNDLPKEPDIKIEPKIDKELNFGDIITIYLEIYTGNYSNKEIEIYIQKDEILGKKTKIKLQKNYQTYNLKLPFPIDANRKEKHPPGEYSLIINTLNQNKNYTIQISNKTFKECPLTTCPEPENITCPECPACTQTSESNKIQDEFISLKSSSENNINNEEYQEKETIYKSSSEKSKDYITYGFIALLTLIIIGYTFKNGLFNKSNNRSDWEPSRTRNKSYAGTSQQNSKGRTYRTSKKRYSRSRKSK